MCKVMRLAGGRSVIIGPVKFYVKCLYKSTVFGMCHVRKKYVCCRNKYQTVRTVSIFGSRVILKTDMHNLSINKVFASV